MQGKLRLGVMALYLHGKKIEERTYFRRLLREAAKMNIDAYVFTPEDVEGRTRRILAHVYDFGHSVWRRRRVAFPDAVFDRCRYQRTPRFQKLRQFRAKYPELLYLNRPLANKWVIHQLLSKDATIRSHLPDTEEYKGTVPLERFLKKHNVIFVKPVNGTGGRGVIRIEKAGQGMYLIRGRDKRRAIVKPRRLTLSGIGRWLEHIRLTDRCIMQQGIDLTMQSGRVHDYRLLMQKNDKGEWEATGCAGRVGAARSVTSNLHGGGRAVPMRQLLQTTFGQTKKAEVIEAEIASLGIRVVQRLDSHYKEMCELALDVAVDRQGKSWLLETNPKPARDVFRRIGDHEMYHKAIIRPLQYAKWLHASRR
jgi:hypothetical protein